VSAERAHAELERLVPREDAYDFHVNLIAHGRQVCLAREPRCGACALQELCEYYAGEAVA
jgi:endonuclease-3